MEFGFLEDIKGDMCRLGYILIIPTLLSENAGCDEIRLANLLENKTTIKKKTKWEKFPTGLSDTALIPRAVSKNLVELASKIGFFSMKKKSLGNKAKLSKKIFPNVLDSSNPLILTINQKIFLCKCMLESDGISLFHLMKFIIDKSDLQRKEILDTFMEELLPLIIQEQIDKTSNSTKKNKLKKELIQIKAWPEQRKILEGKGVWNTSDQYAKYRHFANPRPEWLVDLGFLSKKDKKFSPTDLAPQLLDAIKELLNDENASMYDKLIPVYYPKIEILDDKKKIKREIVDCFDLIRQSGNLATTKNFLIELVILANLLKKRMIQESKIRDCIEELVSDFSESVREMLDPQGNRSIIRIKNDLKKEMFD